MDNMKIDLTDAVDVAAKAVAKEMNVDWENYGIKMHLREFVLVPVTAAVPVIIQQVLKEISMCGYEIS